MILALVGRKNRAEAVNFDGTNDYLTRSGFTGDSDSSTGILSFWIKLAATGSSQSILTTNTGSCDLTLLSSNKFQFQLNNGAGSSLEINGNTALSGSTWYHCLISWNTNFSAGNKIVHIYLNDSSDAGTHGDASGAFTVDYTPSTWGIGATTAGGQKVNADIAEFIFMPGQFLDFSSSANRRKFIDAAGKPNLTYGTGGGLITGTPPLVLLNRPASQFQINAGTGGNLTVNGTLTNASTSPSD